MSSGHCTYISYKSHQGWYEDQDYSNLPKPGRMTGNRQLSAPPPGIPGGEPLLLMTHR